MATEQSESLGFSDFLATLRRRRRVMAMVGVPIAIAAVLVALFAPTRYRSEAVYQIEAGRLADMGATTGGQRDNYVDQYIKDLQGVVLGPAGLRALLTAQNRLPKDEGAQASAVEKMRDRVGLRVVNEQVLDPQTGRERTIISSFRLYSDADTPAKAQEQTQWLSTRFVEADRATRMQRAENYSKFLDGEVTRRKTRADELERQLADFKQKNIGMLPEQSQLNMDLRDRAERDLAEKESQIRTLMQERSFAQQQLVQASSQSNGGARLQELEQSYRERLQSYDANHPDMLALQREIDTLRAGGGRRGGTLREQLSTQQAILAQARQRYSDDHPDVKRIQRNIAALQQRIASGEKDEASAVPSTPQEVQLRTQVNSLDQQIASLQSQVGEIRQRIASMRTNIQSAPQVERQYQAMMQDLTVARTAYQDALQKKVEADAVASAIGTGTADAFRLAQRATLPEGRMQLRSLAVLIIGLFLAATLAFAAALGAEMFDPTVRGSRDIRQVLGVAPLAIIPEIANSTTFQARRARWMRLAASVAVATVVLFAVGYRLAT